MAQALVAAADADTGAQALRTAAVVRLLLHNALRVDEACAADVADLGENSGHRVLRVVRKGARKAKIPLTPAMQFEISDPAAAAFARGFYAAIARGRGIDDAVSSGQVAILGLSDRTLEWVTPVLYLRGHDTRLFTLPKMETAKAL